MTAAPPSPLTPTRSPPSASRTGPPRCCPAGPTTTRRSTSSSASEWFRRDWVIVGREEDAGAPGTYFLAEVDDEPLIVVRGRDGVLRGVLQRLPPPRDGRRRGAVRQGGPLPVPVPRLDLRPRRERSSGPSTPTTSTTSASRRSAWSPVRLETWQGFVFVNLDPEAQPLVRLAGRPRRRTSSGSTSARCASPAQVTYDVDANWKFIAENYSECYHCPGIHPQLNKLTPYDLGGDFAPDGPWQGGWMELVDDAETMALDGGHRAGRPAMAGITELDERRIYYYLRLAVDVPVDPSGLPARPPARARPARTTPGSSAGGCSSPTTIAAPGFDPSDAIAFWDLTNRQDWHVCELQQRGTRSRSWVAGRYSNQEPSVHAFDLMVRRPLRRRRDRVGRRTVRAPLRRAARGRPHARGAHRGAGLASVRRPIGGQPELSAPGRASTRVRGGATPCGRPTRALRRSP